MVWKFAAGAVLALGIGTAEAADPATFKIGVLGDYSSAYSAVGGKYVLEAAKMAAEDFGGSVLGRKIELLPGDTQLKPDVASTIARQWFDEGVEAITDLTSTNITFAVTPLAEQRGKVLLVTSAASSDITGAKCSPVVAHWTYDTYGEARSSGSALIEQGAKTLFFLNQDTVTGQAVERDMTQVFQERGGKVVGSVAAPVAATDFSPFILQAIGAKADVYTFAPAGSALVTAVKQAREFGLTRNGGKIVGVFMMPDDVKAIGLETAQGLLYATAFDPDLNDQTRAFTKRFLERAGKIPNMNMVGTYSAVLHYLQAVKAVGSTDAAPVMAKMRETPVHDVFTDDGHLRIDGKMAHSMYLVQVKSPAESRNEWDLTKVIATIPAGVATRPLNAGGCPLVK